MTLALATLALGMVVTGGARGEPEISPEQVILETSELTMKAIKARREELRANRQALFELIEEVLLPRWDRQYTGQLVMGRYWPKASPEQREAFITGLYRKLLDSYGDGALVYDVACSLISPLTSTRTAGLDAGIPLATSFDQRARLRTGCK